MSAHDETLAILREPSWTSLVQRLEALVAADPKMIPARDTLLRPLRLLQILASETAGALAQDVLAAERLRNLLYLASPWSVLVEEAEQLLEGTDADAPAHEPGVIDMRVLVLVGIAAVRVAPTRLLARRFLHTVQGLALSATPAEMLGQMEPYGHQGFSLGEVVKLMVLPDAGRLADNRLFLPRFGLDPLSLGRWQCLRRLLNRGVEAALDTVWAPAALQYAAHADSITAVHPADAAAGTEVTLSGVFPELQTGNWPKPLHVVFATPLSEPRDAEVVAFGAESITVVVPADASPGWIGLADERLVSRANQGRRAVRKLLAKMGPAAGMATTAMAGADAAAVRACLDGAIPGKWVPDLKLLPVPPRTAGNRFFGGVSHPELPPSTSDGPRDAGGQIRTIVLFRPIVADGNGARVEAETFQQIGLRLLGGRGVGLKTIELPWIDDPLAVLSHTLRSEDDPRIRGVLDQLSSTALRTPGLEHALWLMVVPGTHRLAVYKPAEAAAAVAIATLDGLPVVFEHVLAAERRPPERSAMERLRIIGHLLPGSQLRIQSSRVEAGERFVGPGALVESEFVAVALNASDVELHREPIKVLSSTRPCQFGLLFPIAPEVACVEIRNKTQAVFAIRRTDQGPSLFGPRRDTGHSPAAPRLKDDVLQWRYQHPLGIRSQTAVEVLRDGLWTRFTALDGCRDEQALPLGRLERIERLRLVASDGWNATEKQLNAKVPGPAVVARRVNATHWWADVAPGWPVAWHVNGMPPRRTRLLEVDADVGGTVKLVATDPRTGKTFQDQRTLAQEDWA